jgi:hypothetical protein
VSDFTAKYAEYAAILVSLSAFSVFLAVSFGRNKEKGLTAYNDPSGLYI